MMKWKQGTKEGVCAVTNAAGLREALKAAGAIVTEDLDITVKKGPFGRMKLLALLNKADSASPTAANFEPSCTIEVAVPVELSNVLMHIAMGDKSGTLKVAKPATAETVTSALVEAGWIENKDGADKASITFANMEFGLADILDDEEARRKELCALLAAECSPPPVTAAELQVKVKAGEGASEKAVLLEQGWPYVKTKCLELQTQNGWSQGVLATKLGVSATLVSQLFSDKYVKARAVAHGGLMTKIDAENWANHFARAEAAAAGGGVLTQAGDKAPRAPGFFFKKVKIGSETVEQFLLRTCEWRINSGGLRDDTFLESVVGRVNNHIGACR